MPLSLLDRCRPDSIQEFRAAARHRSSDAQALASNNRRTAAIYLWGYAAEMTLKAAYFRAIGFDDIRPIAPSDLRAARNSANSLGIAWPGNLHDIRAWAELVVVTRASLPGMVYATPGFGNQIVSAARQLGSLWRETLRYHKNIAYPHEVQRARRASLWFLENALKL
jgi:hypothetical protein